MLILRYFLDVSTQFALTDSIKNVNKHHKFTVSLIEINWKELLRVKINAIMSVMQYGFLHNDFKVSYELPFNEKYESPVQCFV